MNIIQGLILGIVQGFTEFLPISSSAHLVLVPYLLNWQMDPSAAFVFDVLVQLGTLGAVIFFFRKDLAAILGSMLRGLQQKQPFAEGNSRLGWLIILATIPAGLAGLLLKDAVEGAFSSPIATGFMLLVTALFLTLSERFSHKTRELDQAKPKDALVVGLFQAVSIFPGISRSGSTMTGGLLSGFTREAAARFSFLMSIPIMAAAGLLALLDLFALPGFASFWPTLVIGFIAAALTGYFSIQWLLNYVRRKSLLPFAVYCALLAAAVFIVTYAR